MKLKDMRDHYYGFTSKTSDILRQLSFAGLAIIWVFKSETTSGVKIPHELALSAILFIWSLSSDFLHYLSASMMWGIYSRLKELKGTKFDDDIKAPRWINWPSNGFFIIKSLLAIWAYISLLSYLYKILFIK